MIIGIISPFIRDLTGFSGMMFRIVSVIVRFAARFVAGPVLAKFIPMPGLITEVTPKATISAMTDMRM